jgi:hypothetical protein
MLRHGRDPARWPWSTLSGRRGHGEVSAVADAANGSQRRQDLTGLARWPMSWGRPCQGHRGGGHRAGLDCRWSHPPWLRVPWSRAPSPRPGSRQAGCPSRACGPQDRHPFCRCRRGRGDPHRGVRGGRCGRGHEAGSRPRRANARGSTRRVTASSRDGEVAEHAPRPLTRAQAVGPSPRDRWPCRTRRPPRPRSAPPARPGTPRRSPAGRSHRPPAPAAASPGPAPRSLGTR